MRLASVLLLAVLAGPAVGQRAGGPFTVVETGRSFARLAEAVDSVGDGSATIRIASGVHRDCAVQERGRVAFVAAEPGRAVFERTACEDKAALVLRGRGARVEGLVFRDLEVADGNGAGIRLEKGNLEVANCMFLDSQSGILTAADPASRVAVDRSTFSGLGKDPTGNGAHGIYVGGYGSLRVANSRFERGRGGHYLKSRAPRIEVLDSSFDDTGGRSTNYAIDLSNGASGRIAGNEFVVGPNKDNYSTVVTVAPEGARNGSDGLVVEGNGVRLAPGADFRTTFVGTWTGEAVTVRGNRLGPGVAERARRW